LHDVPFVGFPRHSFILALRNYRTYKGYKIEWDNDECAAPLEAPAQPRKHSIPAKKENGLIMNRFQLLHIDGDGIVSDDDDNDTSGINLGTALTTSVSLVA
jgi:hypothetical protein